MHSGCIASSHAAAAPAHTLTKCELSRARRTHTIPNVTTLTPPPSFASSRFRRACLSRPGIHAMRRERLVCSSAHEMSPGMADLEGGYTPFEDVNFGPCEIKNEVSMEVDASPETCYLLWKDPNVIADCFDFIIDYTDFSEEGSPDSAGITLLYRLGTYPTLELKFLWERTEDEENSKLSFHTIEGMPILASVSLAPTAAGATQMNFSTLYSLPVQLGMYEDPLVVHRHVGYLLKQYLQTFKETAEAQ